MVYLLIEKKNMDTEEDILVAVYINLINMVMHLPGIYQPSDRLIFSMGNYYEKVKKIYEIFCFCKRFCR